MTNETEPTAAERAVFIGEGLGLLLSWEKDTHEERYKYRTSMLVSEIYQQFTEWLSSPDGLDAVEREMIKRGYTVQTTQYSNNRKPYCHMWNKNTATSTNKSEAILTAAYRTLKSEKTHG